MNPESAVITYTVGEELDWLVEEDRDLHTACSGKVRAAAKP